MDTTLNIDVEDDPRLAEAIDQMHEGGTVLFLRGGTPVAALIEPEALALIEESLDAPLLPEDLLGALTPSDPPLEEEPATAGEPAPEHGSPDERDAMDARVPKEAPDDPTVQCDPAPRQDSAEMPT